MKKAAFAVVALVLLAAMTVVKTFTVNSAAAGTQNSQQAASSLQSKIDTIKKAEAGKNRRGPQKLDISESELESYVLMDLKKDIPLRLESIRIQLTPSVIAADARLTIPSGSTGNALLDALVSGTHNFHIKGKLIAGNGMGKFDLQEVNVDGIPVPGILIDTLIKKYVKPRYPEADLKEPFDLPWGIDAIAIGQGKAVVTY